MSDLYEAVERHKKERHARSASLKLPLIIVAVLFVVALYPIVSTVRAEHRYQYYTGSLTESVNYAGENGTMTITRDGVSVRSSDNSLQQLYSLLLFAEKDEERRDVPDGEGIVVSFGDGSTLEIRYTEVQGAIRYTDCSAIRYTDAAGWQYCYATHLLRYSLLLSSITAE